MDTVTYETIGDGSGRPRTVPNRSMRGRDENGQ